MKYYAHNVLFYSILVFSLSLFSCVDSSKFLEKPKDTNLDFWITEHVSSSDFNECTYLPGWFGASEYLDRRYKATDELKAPTVHVTYLISGYPDVSDSSCVTRIEITDKIINVYGLTFENTEAEISQKMISLGFVESAKEGSSSYYKNNVDFFFNSNRILISASSTNRNHIVF